MKTRIAAWTILAMCAQALIGCGGSNASYNPVSPSPPPPTTAAPTPPPSLAVDLTGSYAMRFEVGDGCEQVPNEFRTRIYEAQIRYYKSAGSADWFFAELTGSKFHYYQPVLIEVSDNSVFVDLSDNVILEESSPGSYLATSGVGVAAIQSTELSTISGSFTGYFKYCAGTQNQCSVDAMVRAMCKSENSRWTLTRR